MYPLLIVLSLIAGGLGFIMLSPATMGVGIMAGGCILAIWARIAQAQEHFRATQKSEPPLQVS